MDAQDLSRETITPAANEQTYSVEMAASGNQRGSADAGEYKQPAGTTGRVVGQVEHAAGQLLEETKRLAGQVVEGTKHTASEASDRVTGAVTDKAVRQTIALVIGQKDDAAMILSEAARALRETGARLQAQDKADVARTAERAATQLTRFSGYLNTHDTEEIAGDAERIARAIPAGVLSGALTVGLLAGRLLDKSDKQS
jgi:hypothetical protein